jgi:hypothetical protein
MRRLSSAAAAALAIVLSAHDVDSAMLGPDGPMLADINGDGKAGDGDFPFWPESRPGDPMIVRLMNSPWDCMPDQDELFSLRNTDGNPKLDTGQRTNDEGAVQQVTFTEFAAGDPVGAVFEEMPGPTSGTPRSGKGSLHDDDGDGVFDAIELTDDDSDFTVMMSLVVQRNEDGVPEFVTTPMMMAPFVNRHDDCGPPSVDPDDPDSQIRDPQVFVPLHEIESGPHPVYGVVGDFDGDGTADAQLHTSPALAAAPNQPPDCAGVTPGRNELWPPNHRFVPVHLGGASDPEGDPVEIQITGVTQDEADGSCPDAKIIDQDTVELRAERLGGGDGRVYHVGFTATDDGGEACSGQVKICVPHDQGHGMACVDQGPQQNSITCGP